MKQQPLVMSDMTQQQIIVFLYCVNVHSYGMPG